MLSQNEIRARARTFSEDWKLETNERAEKDTFYNEFFEVFGRKRRRLAQFEKHVKKLNNTTGFIDLFWPGVLIVEHKSAGRDLDAALTQAEEYCEPLDDDEHPRFLMTCDFQNFQLVDLDNKVDYNFKLSEFSDKTQHFDFMRGLTQKEIKDEDPVNVKASAMMGKIYEQLDESGYPKTDTIYLLTRLTYCLFADDTGIFEFRILEKYLKERTAEDGTDLGNKMVQLFEVLNEEIESRQNHLDDDLKKFPYINGHLFSGQIKTPSFNSKMRNLLIDASSFDWKNVSPVIFGSLFQSVMNKEERRGSGGHYTDESNIMKVIEPLFLDDLKKEFKKIKSIKSNHRRKELEKFQNKLANLKFLDPACGSGNFLIVAYREIRKLELEIIKELHDTSIKRMDVSGLSKVDVDQFYGIEINMFSAYIAETALWMMDHIMNNKLGLEFGESYARIPLKKHPNIWNVDALETDWNDVIPSSECSYILGNPPFGGSKEISVKQREQIKRIANLGKSGGTLDYVCSWFLKAGEYAKDSVSIGFVSTNSIVQGEQVAQLWPVLFERYGLDIIFAHEQFKWNSEAPGKAAVIVVIIGLSKNTKSKKRLFHYDDGKILEENPKYISPYLIGSDQILPVVNESSKPLNGFPPMKMGTKPIDHNIYIFTDDAKNDFLKKEPDAKKFFRPYVNGREFLNGIHRWILKLDDAEPNELKNLPEIKKRIELVKEFRLKSIDAGTRKLAEFPRRFHLNVTPAKSFLVVPATSSEKRDYIPIGYLEPPIIPSNAIMVVEDANLGLFGLLISKMHMIWVRLVGGKLKMDLRYSAGMVYNTFPIPSQGYGDLEKFTKKILEIRKKHSTSTLANLYDSTFMPPDLKNAHINLDRAVEKLYRKKPFESDHEIMEFLLLRYNDMKN